MWIHRAIPGIAIALAACAPDLIGNGNVVPEERLSFGFTGVEVVDPIDVVLNGADDIAVTVYTDSNLSDWVLTDVDQGRLVLSIDPGHPIEPTELRVEVDMPTLASVVHGSSQPLLGANLVASSLAVDSAGTGEIRLAGGCSALSLTAGGSSVIDLGALTCVDVDLTLRGDGAVTVFASGSVEGTMDGSVSLTILYEEDDPPVIDVRQNGSGVLTENPPA
jgi:hypothetical protein